MAVTPKQLALLAIAKKRLAIIEDDYRSILRSEAGVESARDLDHIGFNAVMKRFAQLGFQSDWSKRNFGGYRAGMATPAQLQMIREMWRQYSGADDEAGLNGWLMRTAKVSATRFLDADGVHKAISGLRAMTARKQAKESA